MDAAAVPVRMKRVDDEILSPVAAAVVDGSDDYDGGGARSTMGG